MHRQILGRIGLCFLCGVLLIFVFDVIGAISLWPWCHGCWFGEPPLVFRLLPLVILPGMGWLIYVNNEDWRQRIRAFPLTSPGPQPQDLQIGQSGDTSGVSPSKGVGAHWWWEPTLWIGTSLILLGAGLYLSARRWVATHTFIAFDAPVNSKDGYLRTGNFYINLEAEYRIEIDVNGTHLKEATCQNGWSRGTSVRTRWRLHRDNEVLYGNLQLDDVLVGGFMYPPDPSWVSGTVGFWVPGTVERYSLRASFPAARPGYYNLDVEVLSNTDCFDVGNPWVKIHASSDSSTLAQGLGVMLGTTGMTMLLLAISKRVKGPTEKHAGLVLFGNASGPGYFAAAAPSPPVFSKLPPFGLFVGLVLIPLAVFVPLRYPRGSIGIPPPEWGFAGTAVTRTQPLILRLKFNEYSAPLFSLNSKPLRVDELASRLKAELEHRSLRTVYVQADDDVIFQDVINVIEIIRACKAKVLLVSSGSQPD